MTDRFFLTVLLYLEQGKQAKFHDYERSIKPLIEQYGGQFEQLIKPSQVSGETPPLPDEIHILSFPTEQDFQSYRQDPNLPAIAHLGHSQKLNIRKMRGIETIISLTLRRKWLKGFSISKPRTFYFLEKPYEPTRLEKRSSSAVKHLKFLIEAAWYRGKASLKLMLCAAPT